MTGPGRPPIGKPVTVTLPEDVLKAVDALAAQRGVGRAEQLRGLVSDGLAGDDSPETSMLERDLQPAAALLVRWIGENHQDRAQARARFLEYNHVANNSERLVKLIEHAWGHLYLAGARDLPLPSPEVMARLSDKRAWRLRGGALFTLVMTELIKAGVKLDRAARGEAVTPPDDDIGDDHIGEDDYA